MRFQHHDLGHRSGGEIVEITLQGSAANVRLMDSTNFQSYRAGSRHRYYGGHVTRSPYRLPIPRAGRWHVTIDLGGYAGRVRSGVHVLPGKLSPARQTSLSSVPSLVRRPSGTPRQGSANDSRVFDVFVSHASEGKENVVRPLAHALRDQGLEVWYDEFELQIGDSLRQKIDKGLANSRFGIVVLSRAFFDKGWTNYELDGLVTRSVTGEQVLLPIWHDISKQEVIEYSPSLADKVARNTTSHTVDEIAAEIAELILSG